MSMSDLEVRDALQKLTDRIGQVETEVRVVKHDLNNMAMASQGLDRKLEKIEERMGLKFDSLTQSMGLKVDALSEKVGTLNIKQERGLGFFAGISFVVVTCGGLLLGMAKLIWG